ncbi:hypothetical protein G6F55_006855 [Rhizopus delemar]|nr:hypothetical protein G6F55_006855 [Rhizopus delemar]
MSSYRTFNKAKCLKMKPNNYSQQQLRTQSDWQFTLDTKPNNRMRKPKDTHLKPFDSHQALSIWKQKLQVKEKPSTLISLENTTLPIINTNLIKQPVDTVENQTRTWGLNLQQLHLPQPNLSKCNQQSRTQTIISCSTSVPTTSTALPITTLQQQPLPTANYEIPTDGIAPGGRLQQFITAWKSTTTHPWPLSVIQHGYKIQFAKQPVPWRVPKKHLSAEDQLHVNIAIQKFLTGEMIEVSPSQNKNFLSNFFTLQEQTKRRPILDCQKLNSFLQVEHFKMEGVPALREIIEENDYICKIDLKDAYVVIPIHPDSQDYLSFENQGIVYRYKSLAFGLSVAPRIFSKIMKYAIEPLRSEGHRLVYYLDDICLLEKPKEKMQQLTYKVAQHLQRLGFIINFNKSMLTPAKTQEFLGFQFNTKKMEISVPSLKITNLLKRIKQLESGQYRSCRWIASLLGKMTAMIPAVGEALLHLRYLQRDLSKSLHYPTRIGKQYATYPVQASKKFNGGKHSSQRRTDCQSKSPQIHNQIRRDNVASTSRISDTNTESMQLVSDSGNLPTRSRDTEHTSRSVELNQEATLRIYNPKENVPINQQTMGTSSSGCIRSETQPATTTILGTESGSRSNSNRCISTELEHQRTLPSPTLETDPKSLEANQIPTSQESSSGDATVVKPILVPDDTTNETSKETNHMEAQLKMVFSRMALINNFRKNNGINQGTINFLNQKIRKATQRAYDNGWKQWSNWCHSQGKDPCNYNPQNALAFLMANQQYSNNHLNRLRSAIASVFSVVHETKLPIADHKLTKDFFAAKRRSTVKIPTMQQLFAWDITILLQHIQNTMSSTCNLSLQHLQLKTILLLCMATMWRPRSDIGCLQHRDITINNDQKGEIQATIHTRTPKEAQVKSITLGTYQDQQLCPVQMLKYFLDKTSQYRTNLPEDHTLFLTYLEQEDKKSSSVHPSTIANWIKSAMQDAGIDTKHFQAHSIQSASSTKAVELGHSIQDVKKHANWGLNSNTFEKFYYKPSSQVSSSAAINHSIFSSTDNSITLEVGVESIGISLGTTSNPYK